MTEQQQLEFKLLKDQVALVNKQLTEQDKKLDEIISAISGNKLSDDKGMVGQLVEFKKEQLLMQTEIEELKKQVNDIKNIISNWKGIAIGIMAVGGIVGYVLKILINKI